VESKPGRKRFLDGYKRREILAILAVGGTWQTAAEYVGCSVQTIRNTAQRDRNFAAELRRKSQHAEINYLQNIRAAAQNERYWRAAAWALERLQPDRYGKRGPDAITIDQIVELLAGFSDLIIQEVPAKFRKNVLKRLYTISCGLKEQAKKTHK